MAPPIAMPAPVKRDAFADDQPQDVVRLRAERDARPTRARAGRR
jgi:hypothetical protein